MMKSHSLRFASLAAAPLLVLGLAACSGNDAAGDGEIAEVEAIPAIPAPDGGSWADTTTVSDKDGYVLGNPDAPIKLVEYASHTCSHCADFSTQAAEPLRDQYVASGRVSYEIRNQIHDPIDLTFATLARCAGPNAFHPLAEQGWRNLPTFFENIQSNQAAYEAAGQLEGAARMNAFAQATGMLDWFAARGLSEDQAKTCLADQAKIEGIVSNSQAQSQELDVTGTPTFFINGRNVGTVGWPDLEPMLQRAGAR